MTEIPKKWGKESIICNNEKYCSKFLFVNKGFHSSRHAHIKKEEDFHIILGKILLYVDTDFRPRQTILVQGDTINIKPGTYHQFTGIRDSIILEISTHHEDKDTIRETESGKTKICYVDVDGFLFTENHKGDYHKAKPIKANIELINKKYDNGELIIIWTARGQTTGLDWTKLTEKQLKRWGVKHHDLLFDKPFYDEIWDDKANPSF